MRETGTKNRAKCAVASVQNKFATGAILHTGGRAYPLADQIQALPICTLWT